MNEIFCLDCAGGFEPRPTGIREAMAPWLVPSVRGYPSNPGELVAETRAAVAEFFGAVRPGQVIFTKNASEALNAVIRHFMGYGGRALTTVAEHESVIDSLTALNRETEVLSGNYFFRAKSGWKVVTGFSAAELREGGTLDYESLREAAIKKRPGLIVCTHASALTGDLTDLAAVGEIAKSVGARFVVDCAQTAGVLPVDIGQIGADAVCFSGYKGIPGPRGIGGIVVAEDSDAGEALRRTCEYGSLNLPGAAGLLAAVRFLNLAGRDSVRRQALERARQFVDGVRELPGATLYGNYDDYGRAPIVAFGLKGRTPVSVSALLREKYGIRTAHGSCGCPLHADALGIGKHGAVRVSFSHRTPEEAVGAALKALEEIADEEH